MLTKLLSLSILCIAITNIPLAKPTSAQDVREDPSAIESKVQLLVEGEGLVGLTRGFMYAGTPRVLTSLWKVEDEATAEFMKWFYAGILKEGKSAAEALRVAQMAIQQQKRWQSACYWAAFSLQGEWRK